MRWVYAVVALLVLSAACTSSDTGRDDTTLPPVLSTTTTTESLPTTTALPPTTTSAVEPVVPQLDLDYGRRHGFIRLIGVHWHGLPDEADHVVVVVADRSDRPVEKPVVAGQASFEIGKPNWTKYATFTAYDAQGTELLSQEVLLDGGSCSAKGNAEPSEDAELPDAVNDTRIYLAERAIRCQYTDLARSAVEGGTFFDRPPDDLAADLKELDRRQGIMLKLYTALQSDPRKDASDGQTVYVFTAPDIEIVLDSEGRWIAASA